MLATVHVFDGVRLCVALLCVVLRAVVVCHLFRRIVALLRQEVLFGGPSVFSLRAVEVKEFSEIT